MALINRSATKNSDFSIRTNDDGTWDYEVMQVVLLMDIRDELQALNKLLHCHNFTGIPATLLSIQRKLPARKPRKKTA